MQLEQTSPVIMRLQQQYTVTVTFRQRPRGYSTVTAVLVRGTVNNSNSVKEATLLLMEHLTGTRSVSVHPIPPNGKQVIRGLVPHSDTVQCRVILQPIRPVQGDRD